MTTFSAVHCSEADYLELAHRVLRHFPLDDAHVSLIDHAASLTYCLQPPPPAPALLLKLHISDDELLILLKLLRATASQK
jgi:hypothetical protein